MRDAIARGAIGLRRRGASALRIERRPPRLDLVIYPYLPFDFASFTSSKRSSWSWRDPNTLRRENIIAVGNTEPRPHSPVYLVRIPVL